MKFLNKHFLFTAGLISIIITVAASLEAPQIVSVTQLNETTLHIKWKVEASLEARFRLFYINEFDKNVKFEWPGQIRKTNFYIKNQAYVNYNSSSTFDCFNQCIKTPACLYAVFKNDIDNLFDLNCILRLVQRGARSSNEVGNLTNYDDKEIGVITDYKNEVTIFNVPSQRDYKFYVQVYDKSVEIWSPLSAPSVALYLHVKISLSFEQVNNRGVIIKWSQDGKFRNYDISRYNVNIYSSKTNDLLKKIPVLIEMSKYKLEPDYIELKNEFLLNETIVDEQDCFTKCLKSSNCVRYVYFKLKRSCYLQTSLNLNSGYFKSINLMVNSLKSEANKCLLRLTPNKGYIIELEFLTPFGDIGYSNKIKVVRKVLDEEESQDFDKIILNNEFDSDLLMKNESDADYETTPLESALTSKYSTDNVNNNEPEYLEYDYAEYDSEKSNKEKLVIYFKMNDSILNVDNGEVIKRAKNDKLIISCVLIGDDKVVSKGEWIKLDENESIIDLFEKQSSTESVKGSKKITLVLDELKEDDSGKYQCGVEEFNEKSMYFNLVITDVPSKPVIESIFKAENDFIIKWLLTNSGGSKLKIIHIEWSIDFKNSDIPVKDTTIYIENDDLKEDVQNIVKFKAEIPQYSYIRLSVSNENGFSSKSDEFLVECIDKNCLDKNMTLPDTDTIKANPPDEIKKRNTEGNKSKEFSKTNTIIIIIVVIILIAIVIVYIIWDNKLLLQRKNKYNVTKYDSQAKEQQSNLINNTTTTDQEFQLIHSVSP